MLARFTFDVNISKVSPKEAADVINEVHKIATGDITVQPFVKTEDKPESY